MKWITKSIKALEEKLQYVATDEAYASADGRPVVESAQKRTFLRSIAFPDEFIFGRLQWNLPFQNLLVSGTWNRPDDRSTS